MWWWLQVRHTLHMHKKRCAWSIADYLIDLDTALTPYRSLATPCHTLPCNSVCRRVLS